MARQGPPKERSRSGQLIHNAIALMISSGGTAILGVVFWGIAARLTTTKNVGRASAEIAAMVLLANLAQLSFTSIFDRFLPVTGDRTRKFVLNAYVLCAVSAVVIVAVYMVGGIGSTVVPPVYGWQVLFAVAVVLWTIFILQDSVLTGLRATRWVPVENILFAIGKIALLPLFLALFPHQGVFLAWTVPLVLSTAMVNWYLFKRRIPRHEKASPRSHDYPTTRELFSLGLGQYVTSLISTLMGSLTVLIVIAKLGATANAYYYIPSLVSTGVSVLLWNLYTSFMVEASHNPDAIRHQAVVTAKATVALLVPSIVIGVTFAPQILSIFGSQYAVHGTTLLRMLLLSLPGTAIIGFYAAFAWLNKRVWLLAGRALIGATIFYVVMLTLIGHFGILAIGIASLVGTGVQGILFLPPLIRRFRMTAQIEVSESS